MSTESVKLSNHLILCHSLLLLPSIFLSIRVFSNESALWHQVAKVLELQLQHQFFQWIFRGWFPLGLTGLISLQSKGLSRVFSNTTVQKHQFFSTQPSLWSNSHIHTWLLEKNIALTKTFQSFLELSCFLHDPANVGNLISGLSVFSKSNLYIWKFSIHILLKPLTVCTTTNCGKFLKRWEYQITVPDSWEICMLVKKQQLEPEMEQ